MQPTEAIGIRPGRGRLFNWMTQDPVPGLERKTWLIVSIPVSQFVVECNGFADHDLFFPLQPHGIRKRH